LPHSDRGPRGRARRPAAKDAAGSQGPSAEADSGRAAPELRDLEAPYLLLFDAYPAPVFLYDPATLRLLSVNDAAVRQYGYSREEFLAMSIAELRPPEDVGVLMAQLESRTGDGVRRGTFRHRRKNGGVFHVQITSYPLELGGRQARLVIAEDFGKREALEQQVRKAQQMEVVGQIAGGMAHDFNNLLTTILTTCELLTAAVPDESALRADLATIHEAAARGATLTAKLLAFSRRKPLEYRSVDLDAVLGELDATLRHLVPQSVAVRIRPGADGVPARADAAAVEQIVANLVSNASDAMPGGGEIEISTERASLDAEFCRTHPGAMAGEYVAIAVRDVGHGMDAITLHRIFEPFFTTKQVGEGAGLGMAMVYGLVKQHGGYVELLSRPGEGTTVRIYLPEAAEVPAPRPRPRPGPAGGAGETILLVEDEPSLRRAAERVLVQSGYGVLAASDGREALEILQRGESVDLVITDVVMPRLGGKELLQALRAAGLATRVLLTSGYPGRGGAPHEDLPEGSHFLAKPWTIAELLVAVRRALEPGEGDAVSAPPT
jgi:two-component system cell cycle sensor histidine kinase/response regulator CckA